MSNSSTHRIVVALLLAALVFGLAPAQVSHAASLFEQGFEVDTTGWLPYASPITRVASGTGGIPAASGGYYATLDTTVAGAGAYTRFGAYSSVWPGPYRAFLDVYLDVNWPLSSGFDYCVASSNSSGGHLRDFCFHVAKDLSTGQLLVAGSNNTNFAVRQDLETLSHATVTASGWYTLRHTFRDAGGYLAVDMELVDSGGNVLFTETRSNVADTIPGIVGGNRYGWFTFIAVPTSLAIDNTRLVTGLAPSMHVGNITGQFVLTRSGIQLKATVLVVDGNGAPLPGVSVTAQLTVPNQAPVTTAATTDASGKVVFTMLSRYRGTWTVAVTNLTLDGYDYDAGSDVSNPKIWKY